MDEAHEETTDEYVKRMILEGYISEKDFAPLKCHHCNGTNLTPKNQYYEEHYVVEYDMVCEDCGNIVGHWVYGNWQV